MNGMVAHGLSKSYTMNKLITIRLFFLLFIFITVLSSCHDNKIFYDINEQKIKTCNGKAIKNLYIMNEKEKIFYHFFKLPDKRGTNSLSLIRLSSDYRLENLNEQVNLEDFKLRPRVEYTISNSTYGDAASSEIKVRTGNIAVINYASSKSCK